MKRTRLILPPGAAPNFRCNVPGCEEVFFTPEEMVRHVTRCVRKNSDVLEHAAAVNASRDPLAQATDQELVDWQIARHSRR